MKELKSNKRGAINYATMKIRNALEEEKNRLREIVIPGRIGYSFFDRQKFDKKLTKKIYRIFHCKINLDRIYENVKKELDIYIDQDFLEDIYGYSFRRSGKYKDYGMVIYFANGFVDNYDSRNDFLATWFYKVAVPQYKNEKKYNSSIFNFSKKPFEYSQRWKSIWEASTYFCPIFSEKDAENTILHLASVSRIKIKEINKYKIIFG